MRKETMNVLITSLLAAGLTEEQILDLMKEFKEDAKADKLLGNKKIKQLIKSLCASAQQFASKEKAAEELTPFVLKDVLARIEKTAKKMGVKDGIPEIPASAIKMIEDIMNGDDELKKLGSLIMSLDFSRLIADHLPTIIKTMAAENGGLDDQTAKEAAEILKNLGSDSDPVLCEIFKEEQVEEERETIASRIVKFESLKERRERREREKAEVAEIVDRVLGKDRPYFFSKDVVGLVSGLF